MSSSLPQESISAADSQREQMRRRLADRYGIPGELVGVPTLAHMLDMSPSTIHARMKLGSFEIPHLRVHRSPKVRLDDLIDWMTGRDVARESRVAHGPEPTKRSDPKFETPLDPCVARAVEDAMSKLIDH